MIYLKINTVGSLLPVRIICILSFCYLCQSEQNKPVLFTEVYFKIRFKVLKHVCGNNCPPETTIAHITRSLIGKKKKIANYVTGKNSENTICTCWHWAALILPDPDTCVGCSQKIVHSIKKNLVPGCCIFFGMLSIFVMVSLIGILQFQVDSDYWSGTFFIQRYGIVWFFVKFRHLSVFAHLLNF